MLEPRLIRGPLDALEARLSAQVGAAKARDPLAPLTILVGSTLLRPYLRRTLAHACGGHANLRLLTMNELGKLLGRAQMIRERREPLPPFGERIIVEDIAEEAGGYFERVAGTPGFAQTLLRLFQELRQAGIAAEDLTAAIDALGQEQNAAIGTEKLRAIAGLLARGQTQRDAFFSADDCIAAANPSRFDASELLIYGVWQVATIQRRMLERLMETVPVTVLLPEAGEETSDAHAPLREWLSACGAREEWLVAPSEGPTALTRLRERLFTPGPAPIPIEADGTARLLSAPDPPREVREAARVCLEWAAEGIPFHEMAITFRQAETYTGLCDEVFREAGIPIYLHDGVPLATQPLGRSLLALLDLIGSPMRRASVMEFLTETALPAATAEHYDGFEPAAWDAISRTAGIVEGRAQWHDRLRRLARNQRRAHLDDDEPSDWLARRLAEIDRLSRFVTDLFDQIDEHPARATWDEHLDSFRALAATYVAGSDVVLERLGYLTQASSLAEMVSFERFWRTVRVALSQIDSLRLCDEQEPDGAFGRRGVNVLDVNSLRHLRFRAVAVLGLAERAFPPPRRQDALLLDAERVALNRVIAGELPLRASGPDPEPLQFGLAVAAASERLLLSFARAEVGSPRPHIPSYFFRLAAQVLSGRSVGIGDIDRLDPAIFRRVPAGRYGASAPEAALSLSEYERTVLLKDRQLGEAYLASRYQTFARARMAWSARWRNRNLTAWDGVLASELQAGIIRRSGVAQAISATRLEDYAACPYRFFLKSVLRLSPVEEPELIERIAALDRGSLVHAVLRAFMARCGPEDPPRAERAAVHRAWLREIAEQECRELEERGQVGYPLLWEFEKTAILEDLDAWYDREAVDLATHRLRPGAFELRFGPKWTGGADTREDGPLSVEVPLPVTVGDATLRFQGRIDRIDWNPERTSFRVIDYKTGRSNYYKDDRLQAGTRLQLPLYLLAASHALRTHGIEIPWEQGEAQYFFATRRGEMKRVRFSGQTLASRRDEFERLLGMFAGRISSGDFHPEPGLAGGTCTYCDCKPACDSRVARIALRKSDSRHPDFTWLAEVE